MHYEAIHLPPQFSKHIHTVPKSKAQKTAFQVLNINTNTSIGILYLSFRASQVYNI